MKIWILLIILLILTGCTYQWESSRDLTSTTYSGEEVRRQHSVGKLRRLALMPIELEIYNGHMIPIKDGDITEEELNSRRAQYQKRCIELLTIKKGYEVVSIDYYDDPRIQGWEIGSREKQDVEVVRAIGKTLNVDGLMLAEIQEERYGSEFAEGMQIGVNLLLLNIPMFSQIGRPDIRIWVLETNSGMPVWSIKGATAQMETAHDRDTALKEFVKLLGLMDNAVPKQLVD